MLTIPETFKLTTLYNSLIGLSRVARFRRNFIGSSILIILIGLSHQTHATLREFETTRLKSTAGTGVGSILMDEATSLNPASIGFYQVSSLYFQKIEGEVTHQDSPTTDPSNQQFRDIAVIASDASKGTAGSISYVDQKRGPEKRRLFAVSLARPVSEKSSLGITYRRGKETIYPKSSSELVTDRYQEFSLGASHAINENFSLGVLLDDPLQRHDNPTKGTIGFQYIFQEYISLMLDVGGDYSKDLATDFHYRGGVQVKFFNDFYLRAGAFRDEILDETGSGAGLGWVGPRLVLEVGVKNTTVEEVPERDQDGEKVSETSFSLALKF